MNKKKSTELTNELIAIRRVKVYQEIARQIEELIKDGKLKPGDKLPTERELTEAFNVSRHSVREAIRVLEKSRLINSVAGSGTYVAMSDNQETINLITTYLVEKTDKLAEIFQLRRIIEPGVARIAAKNATNDDIDQLKKMLKKNQEIIDNGLFNSEDFIQLDVGFHKTIAKATQNSLIPSLIERLHDLFYETRQIEYQSTIRMKTSAKGHIKIIRAIINGDEKAAVDSMENHLEDVESATIKHLVSNSLKRSENKREP